MTNTDRGHDSSYKRCSGRFQTYAASCAHQCERISLLPLLSACLEATQLVRRAEGGGRRTRRDNSGLPPHSHTNSRVMALVPVPRFLAMLLPLEYWLSLASPITAIAPERVCPGLTTRPGDVDRIAL